MECRIEVNRKRSKIMHCKDTIPVILSKYSQKKELRGYSTNTYIRVSASDLYMYIPLIGLPILLQENRCTSQTQ
jgi:hypothetical protein